MCRGEWAPLSTKLEERRVLRLCAFLLQQVFIELSRINCTTTELGPVVNANTLWQSCCTKLVLAKCIQCVQPQSWLPAFLVGL